MASKELEQMRSMLSNLDSQATSKTQPSKKMNGGSEKIDGANPKSPSTNPATRREQYNNYIKTLDKAEGEKLYQTVNNYKEMGLTNEQIYENVLNNANIKQNNVVNPTATDVTQNHTLDLKTKGNFDIYEPKINETNADATFQKAMSQLTQSINALGSLKLASENYQYTTGSTNVADINNIIKEIQKAYTSGIYDTKTIANQLGISEDVVRTIQQGKASELISIGEEFAQDQLKSFFRAEDDYNTKLQRTMEDYNIEKTNLDAQFNSAMQTLRRNLFNDKWSSSVGSAVAGISGSEYMINSIEKQYQQNMDDLETSFTYSTLKQRASYIRAIQDYNTNITRLGEDFDDAVKTIQASVLQQFQEIDNKILSAEDNLKALSKLQGDTSSAMSDVILKYIQGIEDENERQKAMQRFIAANYGIDVSELLGTKITSEDVANAYNGFVTKFADIIASGGKIRQGRCGEPVNEYLKFLGMGLQITQANDLKPYAKSQTPTPGSIAYFDGTQSRATEDGKKYGHTGIVVDYDLDKGTVTLLESNKDTGMRTREYKLSDVTGYVDPTKRGGSTGGDTTSTEGTGGTGGYYRNVDEGLYDAYVNREKTLTSQEIKNIKSDSYYGNSEEERWNNFVSASESYKQNQLTNEMKNIQASRDSIKELRDDFAKATEGMDDFDISQGYKAYRQLKNGDEITIKGITADWLTKDHKDLLNVFAEYDQFLAQGFIDTIISSKKKGASYGQLSDNEGRTLREAYTSANMYIGRENMINQLDKMISNLDTNIKEMTPKQTTSNGGGGTSGGGNNKIGLGDVVNFFTKMSKQQKKPEIEQAQDLIYSGATSEFNTQGGINTMTGDKNMSTTGNIVIHRSNF